MASKITDYPAKTVFDDGDLYDVSTYDGVSAYTSEKMTFAELKAELDTSLGTLYNADGSLTSARTVTLTSAFSMTFSGGLTTFSGEDSTASNYVSKFKNLAGTELLAIRNDGRLYAQNATGSFFDALDSQGNLKIQYNANNYVRWQPFFGLPFHVYTNSATKTGFKAENAGGGGRAITLEASTTRTSIVSTETIEVNVNAVDAVHFDDDATAGNTRLLVYDVDNAVVERVTVGAAGSGGAGFKVLRIPN